jgi:hypothetical protein
LWHPPRWTPTEWEKIILVLKLFFQKRIKSPLCGWNGESEGGKGDEKEILIFDYTNKG